MVPILAQADTARHFWPDIGRRRMGVRMGEMQDARDAFGSPEASIAGGR